MNDYKDILRRKADSLQDLLNKYISTLSQEKSFEIKTLIENTYEITNGRLDAMDYDVKDRAIMNYHDKLDSAMRYLNNLEQERDSR